MTRQGVRDLPALVRLLADRGCDQLNLIRLVVHRDEQQRFSSSTPSWPAFTQRSGRLRRSPPPRGWSRTCRKYLDDDLVSMTDSFDRVLLSDRTRAAGADPFWGALCFEPFSNVVIHADGMVGPCCIEWRRSDRVGGVANAGGGLARERVRAAARGHPLRRPEPYCCTCDLNVFAENQRLRTLGRAL